MDSISARQQQVSDWAYALLEQEPLLADKIGQRCPPVPASSVVDAVNEMLRFLWLCSQQNGVLTPSERVDQVWHEFILFTRSYQDFCARHLTRFIHHQPSAAPPLEAQQYQTTLSLYRQAFGEPSQAYWPCADATPLPCGACES